MKEKIIEEEYSETTEKVTASPEKSKAALLVQEKRAKINTLVNEAIQRNKALEQEITTALSADSEPESTAREMRTTVDEFKTLAAKKLAGLNKTDEIRILVLMERMKKIPKRLYDEQGQNKDDTANEQNKLWQLQNKKEESLSSNENAIKVINEHQRIWKPVRWLNRFIDKNRIDLAEKTAKSFNDLELQTKESEEKMAELSERERLLEEKLHEISLIERERYDIYLHESDVIRWLKYDEVSQPVSHQIEIAMKEGVEAVKSEIIGQLKEQTIRPQIEARLLRDESKTIIKEELDNVLIDNLKKRAVGQFITGSNHFFRLSEQGYKLLNIEQDTGLRSDYDKITETFTLKDKDDNVLKNFPKEDVYTNYLATWRFKSGDKLKDGSVVESWDLATQTLIFIDQNNEKVVVRGVEELFQWEARAFGVRRDTDTRRDYITFDKSDPFKPYSSYDRQLNDEERLPRWFIESRENGSIALSRPIGSFSREECEVIIDDLAQLANTPRAEKNEFFYKMVEKPVYGKGQLGGILNHYQIFDADTMIRALLAAGSFEAAKEAKVKDIFNFGGFGGADLNSIHDLPSRLDHYCQSNYEDFRYFLNNPLIQEVFPIESKIVLDLSLENTRKKINSKDGSTLSEYKMMFEQGNTDDLYYGLLKLLLDNNNSPACLEDTVKMNPEGMKAKFDQLEADLPGAQKILEILAKDNSYQAKDAIIKELAPNFRDKIGSGEIPPEEKYRLLRIMIGGVNTFFVNSDLIFSGELKPAYVREIMLYLRTFSGIEDKISISEINDEMIREFTADAQELSMGIKDGSLAALNPVLTKPEIIGFLARHPESLKSVLRLPSETPDFIQMISEGGSLEANRDQLIHYLFADGDVIARAKSMVSIFEGNEPIDEKLIAFVEARLQRDLREADSEYPTTVTTNGQEEIVPFKDLAYEGKLNALHDMVKRSIAISRSTEDKQRATERNKQAPKQFQFKPGMYLHGFSAQVSEPFVRNGNICGEALGPTAKKDSWPFQVDYSHIQPEILDHGSNLSEIVSLLPTKSFGVETVGGRNGQVIAVTDREKSEWEANKTYFAGNAIGSHTLILGATPSTENHAFLLRDPIASLPFIQKACVEEEHYIPAYAMETKDDFEEGQMVFSFEDYERALAEQKPFITAQDFLSQEDYLDALDVPQQSGVHRYTLKDHLMLATQKTRENGQSYKLSDEEQTIVEIAARLHDVGKGAVGAQLIDNPVVASGYLSKVRGLSADNKELILSLIRHDELLGDIVQGKKDPGQFARLFPDDRHRRMLLTLYKSDVQAIDNNEDNQSIYHQWRVAERLQELSLEPID